MTTFFYRDGNVLFQNGEVFFADEDECCCDGESLCGLCQALFNGGDPEDPNNWTSVQSCPGDCYCDTTDPRDPVDGSPDPFGPGEPQIGFIYIFGCYYT